MTTVMRRRWCCHLQGSAVPCSGSAARTAVRTRTCSSGTSVAMEIRKYLEFVLIPIALNMYKTMRKPFNKRLIHQKETDGNT